MRSNDLRSESAVGLVESASWKTGAQSNGWGSIPGDCLGRTMKSDKYDRQVGTKRNNFRRGLGD